MLLALLLMAAQPGLADAADPEQLLESDDYPQFALVRDLSAASLVDLYVSPQGRVMECNDGQAWGDGELAQAMCDILRHKHLPPAHLADGTPAWGVVRGMARLFIPGTRGGDDILRLTPPTEIELVAPRLLGGLERTELQLVLSMTPAGAVADCGPAAGERQGDLARAICPALRGLKPGQRVGQDGAAVPYVMTLRAGVSVKDAPPPAPEAPVLPQ